MTKQNADAQMMGTTATDKLGDHEEAKKYFDKADQQFRKAQAT